MMNLNRNEWFFSHPESIASLLPQNSPFFESYVQTAATETLLNSVGQLFSVDPHSVCLGHGSEDLLFKLFLYFRQERSQVIVNELSWPTYTSIAAPLGYAIHEVSLKKSDKEFLLDLESLSSTLDTQKPSLVLIATPNNPTGHSIDAQELKSLIEKHQKHFFIIDGVYDTPNSSVFQAIKGFENSIYLYSFSKFFGLPGARIGLGFSQKFSRMLHLPLGISPLAIHAGTKAIENLNYYKECRNEVAELACELRNTFAGEKLSFFPSDAPFLLMDVSPLQSPSICEDLAKQTSIRPKIFIHHQKTYLRWSLGPSATVGVAIKNYLNLLLQQL